MGVNGCQLNRLRNWVVIVDMSLGLRWQIENELVSMEVARTLVDDDDLVDGSV